MNDGLLVLTFLRCMQEAFKKHIEHMQRRSRKTKIHVDSGFYTKENMKKNLDGVRQNLSVILSHIYIYIYICMVKHGPS